MINTILSSVILVAASEMGDKTQLLAFSLAARFRKPLPVMAGIAVATILNHAGASAVGHWVYHQVDPRVLGYILGAMFIAFGFWTLKQDTLDDQKSPGKVGAFVTTTILFFLIEMGDKTQLATAALAARHDSVFFVTVGTTVGMLISDGLAVFLGDKLAKKVDMKWVRLIAAGLFFICGIASLLFPVWPLSGP